MSRENNALLLSRIKEGDEEALSRLTEENIGLVRSLALRFVGRGVDYEDLVQTGTIGMIRAARSFDESFGCVFSTYAVPLIVGEIKRMLRDDGPVKVGRELKRRAALAARTRERMENALGREVRLGELAAECRMTPEETAEALCAYTPVRSLCETMGDDMPELGDTIADGDDPYERICERQALADAISSLEPFQRSLIYLRYKKELSQAQTGSLLGVSQVKISREEKKIIEALKRKL
ncbi:MAG: sigma-70 family RNA polymerase sigma factor [Clostridia bacterium]|nr:sigma-70 family RNA polymerase sigma factor [Clostridia bacterium]